MKKLIVWTMAMVFSLCVSLAFAAEEKKAEPPTTPAKAEEKVIKAEKKEMKAKKKVKKAKKVRKAAEKKEVEKKVEAPAAPAEKK
jgi:hypothetical protein